MFKALKAFVCAGKHDPRELGISFVDREKSREVEEGQSECHVPCFHNVDIRRDFELKDLIGFPGSFGEVRLAVHRASGKEYAVKMMKVQKFLVDVIKSECEIMKNLEHPHLASIVSIFENKKRVYLVMEKYNGGDLFDMIVSKGGRLEDEGNAANVTKQILEGLKYMHDRNIAHCDIKLSNIMLTGETEKPDVKIIDFGVSQYVSEEGLTAEVGSPSFIAPEVLIGSYNLECDLWSLGVVV